MATLGRRKSRFDRLLKPVLILILLGFVIQTVDRRAPESRDPVSNTVVFFARPFLSIGFAIHEGMSSLWLAAFAAAHQEGEIERLREELILTRLDVERGRSREALDWLSQEVSTNIPRGTFDLIPVSVLSGPVSGDRKITWINAGDDKELEPGMIVLGAYGIVGEVTKVYQRTSLVELVTDEAAVWGAEVDARGDLGLAKGTGDPSFIEFHFNLSSTETEPGETLVSSGMAGSIAPGGVPFGKVQELRRSKEGEVVAIVRLPEPPEELRTMFVLPQRRIPFKPGKDQ